MKVDQSLTRKILMGMTLGLIAGLVISPYRELAFVKTYVTGGAFWVGAQIFLACLKVMVVPLVTVSIAVGAASIGDLRRLGSIGGKTMGLFLGTTAFAVTMAVIVGLIVKPGMGLSLAGATSYQPPALPNLKETLVLIFPSNPIQAMAEGQMLQLIVFSLFLGLALTVSGRAGARVLAVLEDINQVILSMVLLLMWIAPLGVFCLMARVFSEHGWTAILPMAKYFFSVAGVLIIHLFIVYGVMLKAASISPVEFFRRFRPAMAVAFTTSSSNATLPVSLEVAEKNLKIDNSIASFVLPLGATVNMDGTAIMQGVATILIANAYGIDLGLSQILTVILMSVLASIGTAGVPGVGLVMLAMVLRQVGLPVEGIGLVLGVDRLLDMMRTVVNVTGDSVVASIVAKSEKALGPWTKGQLGGTS